MISRTSFILFASASLIFGPHPLFALPQIKVTDSKELEITSDDGTSAKLPTGTIGRQINADKQIFKVSYGKDLRGRTNIIIYPDPEKPQALEFKALGQNVKLSNDAVLTIISEDATSTAQFQSGMVGTVTVGDQQLTGGASAKLADGSVSTVAANVPVFAPEPPPKKNSVAASKEAGAERREVAPSGEDIGIYKGGRISAGEMEARSKDDPEMAKYEGPKVRAIEGDVMIAAPGKDIMDLVKSGGALPRLQESQRIAPGSTIQTGPQGKAIISPFPGCIIAVQPNSKISFEEVDYVNKDQWTDKKVNPAAFSNGSTFDYVQTKHTYERKVHLNLMEGGVLSTIKGIKPETLDYQVKTPLAVAAARGTVFGVFGDSVKTLAIVSQGVVEIKTVNGTYAIRLAPGNKVLITKDGGAPVEFQATPEELQAFADLLDSVGNFMSNYDILATGDLIAAAMADDDLQESIRNFRETFQPRLNNFFMTPITSPGT